MTTASQPGYFNLQSFDSLGALGVGMRLFTYAAGTTTHKTAYTDSAGSVAQTYTSDGAGGQYIAMNARGELPSPLYLTAGAYDLALKTSAGATVWTRQADPTGADLAGSGGAASIGYIADDASAVATTVQAQLRNGYIDAKLYAAAAFDGATDDTAKIQAAFTAGAGGLVYIPEGTARCVGLTIPADTTVYGPGLLKKSANGDMITLGRRAAFKGRLHGDGGTYTGRGIVIDDSGAATITNDWWRRIEFAEITEMESYCVEFVGDSDGYLSEIVGGIMTRYNNTGASVKFPTTETANGNRRMTGVMCFANVIADLGGSDNTLILGCEGWPPIMSSTTKKARVIGNRLVGTGTSTIDGQLGVYSNNSIGHTDWTLSATLSGTQIRGNSWPTLALTNSIAAGSANFMDLPRTVYTPTWTGGSPAIGNGQINGSYIYDGDVCKVSIQLTIGSTTTLGSGAWSFSLPFTSVARVSAGSAFLFDTSASAAYSGTTWIQASATTVRVALGASTSLAGSATPFAWATGDQLDLYFEFPVA
jgi:hypothetical protein